MNLHAFCFLQNNHNCYVHPFSYVLIISHLPQGERQGQSRTGRLSLTFLPERQTTVYTCGQFRVTNLKKKKSILEEARMPNENPQADTGTTCNSNSTQKSLSQLEDINLTANHCRNGNLAFFFYIIENELGFGCPNSIMGLYLVPLSILY